MERKIRYFIRSPAWLLWRWGSSCEGWRINTECQLLFKIWDENLSQMFTYKATALILVDTVSLRDSHGASVSKYNCICVAWLNLLQSWALSCWWILLSKLEILVDFLGEDRLGASLPSAWIGVRGGVGIGNKEGKWGVRFKSSESPCPTDSKHKKILPTPCFKFTDILGTEKA